MLSAVEKFKRAMNKSSLYWTKKIEVVAQEGKIIIVRCEGFCWKSDVKKTPEKKI